MLPNFIFKVEKWKFNKDFGVYVSTQGHFKDRHKRLLPIMVNKGGYCAVDTERGPALCHRLVMFTWRPIPNAEILTVDHLNHNKRDNSLENLEWVTREENLRRASMDYLPTMGRAGLPMNMWSNEVYGERHYFYNKTTNEYFDNAREAAKYVLFMKNHKITDEVVKNGANNLVRCAKQGKSWNGFEWEAILNENLAN